MHVDSLNVLTLWRKFVTFSLFCDACFERTFNRVTRQVISTLRFPISYENSSFLGS